MSTVIRRCRAAIFFFVLSSCAVAQQSPPATPAEPQKSATEPAKPLSATSRLAAAKTVFVKRAAGADVAYDAIRYGIEGWGRFVMVDKPEGSDITIEISAPDDSSGVTMSSSTSTNNTTGRPEQSTSTTRAFSGGGGPVRMTVYDSKTKMMLFIASEQAKSAMKQKAREDNLVQAASKLLTKFRDRLEPPPSQ
jgi:hypothetical protein